MENNDIVAASTSASFTEIQYATSQNFVNSENLCANSIIADKLQYYFKFFKSEELKLYSQMTDSEKADFLKKAKEIYNISSFNSNDEFLQLISEHAHNLAKIVFFKDINNNIKIALEQSVSTKNSAQETFKQNQKLINQLIEKNNARWSNIENYCKAPVMASI